MELGRFYELTQAVDTLEGVIRESKEALTEAYAELVPNCPHSKAVEYTPVIRGVGSTRICVICGVTDYASEGGTPGDEYDYGYAGYPSKSFWANTKVEQVTEEERWQYVRGHEWVVKDGKAHKR